MAYTIHKQRIKNENPQDAAIRSKSAALPSVKKALGEIKNVMHVVTATPLKGNVPITDPSKSLCDAALRKQQLKHSSRRDEMAQLHLKIESSMPDNEPVFDEELFDSWDIDRRCCKEQRRDEDIWAEMVMLDINLIDPKFVDDDEQLACDLIDYKELDTDECLQNLSIVEKKEDEEDWIKLPSLPDGIDDSLESLVLDDKFEIDNDLEVKLIDVKKEDEEDWLKLPSLPNGINDSRESIVLEFEIDTDFELMSANAKSEDGMDNSRENLVPDDKFLKVMLADAKKQDKDD